MNRQNKTKPPKLWLRFFQWYCHRDYIEDIEGDLLERFDHRMSQNGLKSAKWDFIKDVIKLFRPGIIRPLIKNQNMSRNPLFKNDLKIGFRALLKRKAYTLMSSLGLAIGFSSALIITLYIQNQFSYDQSFQDSDRIYKMINKVSNPDGTNIYPKVPYALVNIITKDYPEVELGTAVAGPYNSQTLSVNDENGQPKHFVENGVLLADSNFLSVFKFKMIKGNAQTALIKPHSIVLTESTAKRFFGQADPLGQFISPSGKNAIVTGVCADPPPNSHLQFNYLVSSTSVGWLSNKKFNLASTHCYFKLLSKADISAFELKLPKLIDTYVLKEVERNKNISRQHYKEAGYGFEYFMMPLTDLHLSRENLGGFQPGGNLNTVRILSVVAILILIVGGVNFMNLAAARATERIQEVGIRKVMGSYRSQLILQFLIESFLITFLSISVGLLISIILLPYFNNLTGDSLVLHFSLFSAGAIAAATIMVSLLAGIYPAFILSRISPSHALKSQTMLSFGGSSFKNALVTFQFFVTICLIITTLVINKQLAHTRQKDLGFDKDRLIVIEGIAHKQSHLFEPFLEEIRNISHVEGAAGSLWVQGFGGTWSDNYRVSGSSKDHYMQRILIGDQFSEVLDFDLLEGQFFSENTNDSMFVILNESAVQKMALTDPVGQELTLIQESNGENVASVFTVKGVIKDFHYSTLHQPIEPLVIQSNENNHSRMRFIIARLNQNSNISMVQQISNKWKGMFPDRPFRFRFLDDTLNAKYQSEQQTASILNIFSLLTVIIAGMGLFALSSYTVSLRIKEIGIRKVLGAKVENIISMLSGRFLRIAIYSFIIAAPVGWYIGSVWLENFTYKTDISFDIFILTGGAVLIITCLTVSLHTLKAAYASPIESLRNE